MERRNLVLGVVTCIAALFFFTSATFAEPVQVKYETVYGQTTTIASSWYSGGLWAGIYKLTVDGVPMDSFCIDLDDYANTGTHPYGVVDLKDAAEDPFGPMGTTKAIWVEKLWDMAYDPDMTKEQAAGLQLAIWEVLSDENWNLNDGNFKVTGDPFGAGMLLSTVLNHQGQASLVALTNNLYQDYVVAAVPEPATMLLLGAGLIGLAGVGRRRLRKA